MSQYGYGYVPPPGWQPPNAYSQPPLPSYNATLYQPTDETYMQYPDSGNMAMESYEHNRQTIPGLGFNFHNNVTRSQQPWMNGPVPLQSGPAVSGPVEPHLNFDNNAVRHEVPPQATSTATGKDDDKMEEGELSEGELDDIYESRQQEASEHGPINPPLPEPKKMAFNRPAEAAEPERREPSPPYWGPEQATRERSGSYSPYLSPREIHSNGQVHSASDANGRCFSDALANDSNQVATAKQKAEEAVRRLWPLNIRYENYLEEGIDKDLLDNVFKDLGLDPAVAKILPEKIVPSPGIKDQGTPKEAQDASATKDSEKASNGSSEGEKPLDKSEERKDRIARLLAAKGSKPAAPIVPTAATTSAPSALSVLPAQSLSTPTETAIESSTPSEAPTAAKGPRLTKSQSEKSKLIQQKMEALRKQREANKSVPPPQALATPVAVTSLPQPTTLPNTPAANDNVADSSLSGPSDLPTAPVAQPLTTLERSDSIGGGSIPGLFLSAPQPSPVINERKRPVAADLNENSDANNHKRPFGQTRHSQPFLIDVSDEEGDTDMDIDSPEDEPTPNFQPSTPGRTTSFRDYPALPDSISHRQLSSPRTGGTPIGYGNGIDLEHMNKQIEDMKRKIAEAEARKKAKLSNNGTPSVPQSQVQSKEGSVEMTAAAVPVSEVTSQLTVEIDDARSSSQPSQPPSRPVSQPPSPAPLRLPKVRGNTTDRKTPLRARIASERLPVLEAHRKEQMRHLKHLQDEIARIERDIQDSLAEERELREEAAGSEPNPVLQDAPGDPIESSNSDQPKMALEQTSSSEVVDTPTNVEVPGDENANSNTRNGISPEEDSNEATQGTVASQPITLVNEVALSEPEALASTEEVEQRVDRVNSGSDSDSESHPDSDSDIVMDEAEDFSSEADEESFDDYEPTEAGVQLSNHQAAATSASIADEPTTSIPDAIPEASDTDLQGVSVISPVVEGSEASSETDSDREDADPHSDSGPSKSTFVPYDTPLHYFHAYRFHPEYKNSVAGGLRSLTYSNKIDVKREVCPDELLRGVCPRGNQCEFQHFENMKAPDDQILLQLGAYGNYEGEQQQEYISGLRALLTDFKNRKIKDFQTISDGIIEYRAKFHGDKTRILPLGSFSL
ncbi:hypothetical protein BGZ63DRAFT_411906 [Mariannaea sp. PMI_226]|nr:hypothetical protein BGZ63DRAFT_411906 [Mariannaea sp. PMI_226]